MTYTDIVTAKVTRMAHGGEGIASLEDGRVAFIAGTAPGDTVSARITTSKKRWARAELIDIVAPSKLRVQHTCPAAAAGAGCCDFSHINADAQLGLKTDILRGQLRALTRADYTDELPLEAVALPPATYWRTRVRLGVDSAGYAGVRRARSGDVIASESCTQPVAGLLDNLPRFTPGSEVIAVLDSIGTRHIVQTSRAKRGSRVEAMNTVVEGTGEVTQRIRAAGGSSTFQFPATAFWQAHLKAPDAYANVIAQWGKGEYESEVAWDLYGGVGAFVPAIHSATGGAKVVSVDYSPAATSHMQPAFDGLDVEVVAGRVERSVDTLPSPGLVVLDPPRTGAGAHVVAALAAKAPERVVHIGCDPATFARDLAAWRDGGYEVKRLGLIDAFPNTHHFETIAVLEPHAR